MMAAKAAMWVRSWARWGQAAVGGEGCGLGRGEVRGAGHEPAGDGAGLGGRRGLAGDDEVAAGGDGGQAGGGGGGGVLADGAGRQSQDAGCGSGRVAGSRSWRISACRRRGFASRPAPGPGSCGPGSCGAGSCGAGSCGAAGARQVRVWAAAASRARSPRLLHRCQRSATWTAPGAPVWRRRVGAGPVPADHLGPGVSLQPVPERGGLPVREQPDGPPGLPSTSTVP